MPTGMWLYSYLALWVLLIVESLLMAALIRQVASLHSYWGTSETGPGLPLGAIAPALSGNELFRQSASHVTEERRRTLVCFLSAGCGSCQTALDLIPWLKALQGVRCVLVIAATPLKAKMFLARFSDGETLRAFTVLADPQRAFMRQYQVRAVPYAVLLNEDWRIVAASLNLTEDDVKGMLARADQRELEWQGRAPEATLRQSTPEEQEVLTKVTG
jgi:hypothetical protein